MFPTARSLFLAAVLVTAVVSLVPNIARGLDCPQPDLQTSGTSVPEDGVLTIWLSSPSGYVTGFHLTVQVTNGVRLVDFADYPTNPATATVRPTGWAGWELAVTASSDCSGPPWASDPVEQYVVVTQGTDPPPPPDAPTGGFPVAIVLLPLLAILAAVLAAWGLLARTRRGNAAAPGIRCPFCGTWYAVGSWSCPRDGASLVPPPPPRVP